jgi:hypothetical protein
MPNHNVISVNFQCPPELWQAIQSKAERLGQDPISVAIATLNEAFGLTQSSHKTVPNEELELVKRKLSNIEQAIKPLLIDTRLVHKLAKLASEIPNKERQEEPIEREIPVQISTTHIYSASMQSLANDDVEDEPDEILYDFL